MQYGRTDVYILTRYVNQVLLIIQVYSIFLLITKLYKKFSATVLVFLVKYRVGIAAGTISNTA